MAMKEKLAKSASSVELTEALVLTRTRAQDLESVKKLNCWASNIGDVNVVRRMPNLEVCSLSINKLTTLRDFAHCYKLQELYVRTNSIQELGDIHYLKNLHKLRSLWLSENPCANRDNYRMTVLKTLPHLQKLDNVVVTEDEVGRAEKEGDDLPVPDNFSYSSVFNDVSSSSEDYKDGDKAASSVSDSSAKWALPRRKRQQKKREDLERERRSCDEGSGSARSGDDGGSGDTRSSGGTGQQRSKTGEDETSPRSDDTENDVEDGEDDGADGESHIDAEESQGDKLSEQEKIVKPCNSDEGDRWAMSVKKDNGFQCHSMAHQDSESEGQDDGNAVISSDTEKDGDVNSNKLPWRNFGGIKDAFPAPEKLENVNILHLSNVDESCEFPEDSSCSLKDGSIENITLTPALSRSNNHTETDDNVAKIGNNFGSVNNSTDTSVNSLNTDICVNSQNVQISSAGTDARDSRSDRSERSLLDKIRLEDSLDVRDSTEEDENAKGKLDSLDLALANLASEAANVGVSDGRKACGVNSEGSTAGQTEQVLSGRESKDLVDWEEHNRMRAQLGVKPVDRIPGPARSINTELVKARNSNVLQAVLCLVKELDKDSLDIVATAVKGRLDSMH